MRPLCRFGSFGRLRILRRPLAAEVALQDGELVTQRRDLDVLVPIAAGEEA